MIERTPMLMVATLAVLSLSACGDGGAAPGAVGGPRAATEEPIDAVPLPLDDNPLMPPPMVVAVATPVKAAPATEEAPTGEPVPATAVPTGAVEGAASPPRIVVAPREPARPGERPVERAVERPVERPAAPAAPEKTPEKPVLTF